LTVRIYIEDERGSRRVEAADFPLPVGGPDKGDAGIQIPGGPSSQAEVLAYIGLAEGELFVQPGHAALSVLCNGTPLKTSQWLRNGDVLRLGRAQVLVEIGEEESRLRAQAWTAPPTDPPAVVSRRLADSEMAGTAVEPIAFQPVRLDSHRRARRSLRPREILLWSGLLLLAAAAWFVFTARSVRVETDPGEARMALDGTFPVFQIAGRFLLRPGVYTVVIEKEGYRRLETLVVVTEERDQDFRFTLEKRPGVLLIATVPERGALVSIDGEEIGATPLAEVELAAGEHTVLIRAERYKDFLGSIEIGGAGSTETLRAELEPRWAAVTFSSHPKGATVRIGGEMVGTSPLTTDLLEGAHEYELLLAGHKPYRSRLAVVAGEPQSAPTARLDLVDGKLALASDPSGARVTVDGVYQGETPLELHLEPGEVHELEVSRIGFQSQFHRAQLQPGNQQQLHVELVPILGEVEIVSDPPDALLYINGEARGLAAGVHRLMVVPQELEVRKEGYQPFRTTITPRQGFPQSIEVMLRTLEEAKVTALSAVIKTSQGQELRLIGPHRFIMGASRREPGRRANETIRDVELTRRYYLGIEEVTNRQFREFDPRHRSGSAGGNNLEIDHHPVVRVTWEAAARYCNWLSEQESLPPAYLERDGKWVPAVPPTLGYRLPTEAEWTRAARYPEGDPGRKYPWGDSLPVEANSGNYADGSAAGLLPTTLPGYQDSYPATAPSGSFLPNPLGILNLGGNVAEWMHDFYSIYASAPGPERDPLGPETGALHVISGSSWMDGSVTELRLSYRDYGTDARPDLGFRIARYAE